METVSPIKNILIMEKYGNYCLAQRDKEGINIQLSEERVANLVNAKDVVPYGLSFTFGANGDVNFRTLNYLDLFPCKKEYAERLKHSPSLQDFGQMNLDITIEGLEKKVKESGADYIYVDNFTSRNMGTYWGISGRAQLMLKKTKKDKKW